MRKQKNNVLLFYVVFVAAVFLDQLTKYLAKKYLADSVLVIKNIFHLTLVKNTGSLFGLFQNSNAYLIWLSIIALGFMMYYYDSIPNGFFPKIFTVLLFAGIIGNLVDRIMIGYVIDFIDFRIWPVFNIADSLIVVGVIGLLAHIYWKSK